MYIQLIKIAIFSLYGFRQDQRVIREIILHHLNQLFHHIVLIYSQGPQIRINNKL